MPDTKITALAAITTVDPAADVLPIVDISDTSMAASGTTKKITSNQILGAGGTATLASATITGAATVGTTFGVTGVSTFAAGTALLPALTTTGDTNTGIYYPAADTFAVTTGGTERYRVDSSGNVGIGVVPSAWASYKALQVGSIGSLSSTTGATIVGNNWFYDGASKYITTAASTIYEQGAGTHAWYSAASGTAGTAVSFGSAKMTLDASGNLLVGTTAAAAGRLDVRRTTVGRGINYFSTASGDLAQVGLYIAKFDNDSTTSQKFIAFSINNDSAGSGQINANGANQAAFGSFSDSRLKENIVSLPSQLDNILSLRPVEFDYKDGSGHQIGFVAQEMQQVYSDAVGESDGFLTVTGWSKTEARLVSAIKELAAKVQALEAKLA